MNISFSVPGIPTVERLSLQAESKQEQENGAAEEKCVQIAARYLTAEECALPKNPSFEIEEVKQVLQLSPMQAWAGKSLDELLHSIDSLPSMPIILSDGEELLTPTKFYLLLTHSAFLQELLENVQDEIASDESDLITLRCFSKNQLLNALNILEKKKVTQRNADGADLLDFIGYEHSCAMEIDSSLNREVNLVVPLAFFPEDGLLSDTLNLFSLGLSRRVEVSRAIHKLTRFPNAKEVSFTSCHSLKDTFFLSKFSDLQKLSLAGCRNIEGISSLSSLKTLKELNLNYCAAIRDFQPLSTLTALKVLSLRVSCIQSLSSLEELHNLRVLELGCCYWLANIASLSQLTNLVSLDLNGCTKVSDSNSHSLSALTKLKSLNIAGTKIRNVSFIENLSSLTFLNIFQCNILDQSPVRAYLLRRSGT